MASKRDDLAVSGFDQRVHLNQRRILFLVHSAKQLQHARDLRGIRPREAGCGDYLIRLRLVDADSGVDGDTCQRLRALSRKRFDVHPALL